MMATRSPVARRRSDMADPTCSAVSKSQRVWAPIKTSNSGCTALRVHFPGSQLYESDVDVIGYRASAPALLDGHVALYVEVNALRRVETRFQPMGMDRGGVLRTDATYGRAVYRGAGTDGPARPYAPAVGPVRAHRCLRSRGATSSSGRRPPGGSARPRRRRPGRRPSSGPRVTAGHGPGRKPRGKGSGVGRL